MTSLTQASRCWDSLCGVAYPRVTRVGSRQAQRRDAALVARSQPGRRVARTTRRRRRRSRNAGQRPDQVGDQLNVRSLCTKGNSMRRSLPPNAVVVVTLMTLSSGTMAGVNKTYPIGDVFGFEGLGCNAVRNCSDEHDEPRRFPPTVGAPYLLLGQRRLTRTWRDDVAQRHCGVAEPRMSSARARCPRPRRDDPGQPGSYQPGTEPRRHHDNCAVAIERPSGRGVRWWWETTGRDPNL